jgi:hypothetical protein
VDLLNPATGVPLESAIIPAAVALAVLIVLFVTDKMKKNKKK